MHSRHERTTLAHACTSPQAATARFMAAFAAVLDRLAADPDTPLAEYPECHPLSCAALCALRCAAWCVAEAVPLTEEDAQLTLRRLAL